MDSSISQSLFQNPSELSQSDFDYTTSEEQTTSNPTKKPRRTNRKRNSSVVDESQVHVVRKKEPSTKNMLTNIMDSITGVSTKVDSLVSRVKEVEEKLGAVITKSDEINQSLLNLKTDFEIKIQNQDSRLGSLEAQVKSIANTSSSIDSCKDTMCAEINKINLILSGLKDSATELQQPLTSEFERILQFITSANIKIDCAYRLGKYQTSHNRPIKIRFCKMSDRNLVWNCKKNLEKPLYLNEDLSPGTRQIHGLLRRKRNELLQSNPSDPVQIDWKKLTVSAANHTHTLQHGSFVTAPVHHSMDFANSQSSATHRGHFLSNPSPGPSHHLHHHH
jgi:hypothetical protein